MAKSFLSCFPFLDFTSAFIVPGSFHLPDQWNNAMMVNLLELLIQIACCSLCAMGHRILCCLHSCLFPYPVDYIYFVERLSQSIQVFKFLKPGFLAEREKSLFYFTHYTEKKYHLTKWTRNKTLIISSPTLSSSVDKYFILYDFDIFFF